MFPILPIPITSPPKPYKKLTFIVLVREATNFSLLHNSSFNVWIVSLSVPHSIFVTYKAYLIISGRFGDGTAFLSTGFLKRFVVFAYVSHEAQIEPGSPYCACKLNSLILVCSNSMWSGIVEHFYLNRMTKFLDNKSYVLAKLSIIKR